MHQRRGGLLLEVGDGAAHQLRELRISGLGLLLRGDLRQQLSGACPGLLLLSGRRGPLGLGPLALQRVLLGHLLHDAEALGHQLADRGEVPGAGAGGGVAG